MIRNKTENSLAKWREHCVNMRSSLGMAAESSPWTSRPGLALAPKLRDSAKETVDIAWTWQLKQARNAARATGSKPPSVDEAAKDFFADISQSVLRKPWGGEEFPCITQTSEVYSFEHDGIVSPSQQMQLQGHSKQVKLCTLTEAQVRSLAGEGFSATCIGAVLHAAFLEPSAPWW